MYKIDLHNMTVKEAEEYFIRKYNDIVKRNLKEEIEVIHGYGSTGEGGKIKKSIRKILEENRGALKILQDENIGHTIVIPLKEIPEYTEVIMIEILEYCTLPKTKEKIIGKFLNYGEPKIMEALKKLERRNYLEITEKGKYKLYKKK